MPRREVKPGDIQDSPTGLFFTEEYQEGRQKRLRIIYLSNFKALVQRAKKTGRSLIVTYPNERFNCEAWLVRLMESAQAIPAEPVLQPQ